MITYADCVDIFDNKTVANSGNLSDISTGGYYADLIDITITNLVDMMT